MPSYKPHFSRFLATHPGRLHFAAHSHHLWPDVTRAAQLEAWDDAAAHHDEKWEPILGDVMVDCQRRVAGVLGLPDPSTLVFAPNIHGLFVRLLSACETSGPIRLLSTDGEFHSFRRQALRLVEAGRATLEVVPTEPFATLQERLVERAARGGYDMLYVSHVFFDSGFVLPGLPALVEAVPRGEALTVLDGYHAFLARPTDLGAIAERAFYMSGGYKYAMAGEGVCFAHAPPGQAQRPVDTGWFASFGTLQQDGAEERVPYATDGWRLAGSTFDPSGLYRLRAVLRWLEAEGLTVEVLHAHVRALQRRFLDALARGAAGPLRPEELLPGVEFDERGHFLTFRRPDAARLHEALRARDVITDYRRDRLRFGFGIYQDPSDVDGLLERLATCES